LKKEDSYKLLLDHHFIFCENKIYDSMKNHHNNNCHKWHYKECNFKHIYVFDFYYFLFCIFSSFTFYKSFFPSVFTCVFR